MSRQKSRTPLVNRFYHEYLQHEDVTRFMRQVAARYAPPTLERLARSGGRSTRRAAVLALGLLSDYQSNAALGKALRDKDRGVRLLAENGIRDLWRRAGSKSQQRALVAVIRANAARKFELAIARATRLLDRAPWFAEAWNQRAIALFHLGRFEDSAQDCARALDINPYHFGAVVGLAHCHLEQHDAFAALACLRRALKLYPDLEGVRAQVAYLERSLRGR